MPFEHRRICFSFDDPGIEEYPHYALQTRDSLIRSALSAHEIQAVLFVCGMRVDTGRGREIIENWNSDGHLIANHSYSHFYYNSSRITPEMFIHDIIRGDSLIKDYENYTKLFRFPFLKQGDSQEKIEAVYRFFDSTGYRIGHVSIDNSDWYIDDRLKDRLEENPGADILPYRDYYISHIIERAEYYDRLASELTGRRINHVLLLHYNLTSALFLEDLIERFLSDGWEIVSPSEAYQDPVYSQRPNIIPMGESIIWAYAKETGLYEESLRYPGEDGVYEEERMDSLGL
ncbi:polysaccharide deacetylase family protein [candidate division WOR-3 bacterium]|nr:polysaccharide deacetylase family protein [candidate division WOR-3 bacterium]